MAPSLIKSISHFYTFDYNKVYLAEIYNSEIFRIFSYPYVPFVLVFIYLVFSKSLFSLIRESFNLKPKGGIIDQFTIVHSALLALYSAWTCYYSCSIVYNFMIENQYSLNAAMCDVNGTMWVDRGFSFWAYHFYISKFYEFLDTWIIILKGKKVSFLQEFHHAGTHHQ